MEILHEDPSNVDPSAKRSQDPGFSGLAIALCLTLASVTSPSHAQDGSNLPQVQQDFEEINNGTNPTLLTTQAGIQYQFNKINPNLDTGLFEFFYT